MILRVLGSDGSFPAAGGACSGYLVSCFCDHLLLDIGCGVLPRLTALLDPAELGALLLTHWHFDHCSDLLPLKYRLQITGGRLRVLAPKNSNPIRDLLDDSGPFAFQDIAKETSVGGFLLDALQMDHPVPAYAVRLRHGGKTLVYTGDSVGGEGLVDFCRGADLLLCDATFTSAQWKSGMPHFSAAQAAYIARKAGVLKLMITHCQPGSDRVQLIKEAREVFYNTLQAENGMCLTL